MSKRIDHHLHITNSVTGIKERFLPLDNSHIKMYVCGPTVYNRPHLGNARSIVLYDILYRLLTSIYPKVTYVRNITDVDDKIINIASQNKENINTLTKRITKDFHEDMVALNCLAPTFEPKATDHIEDMIEMIENLLRLKFAYISDGHILFDVMSFKEYGKLSGRKISEMLDGARVEIADYKKNPADFVLWKPAASNEEWCSFQSPWGVGRPGWHIECSAMSMRYLGKDFDIHGGGVDLIFPHHENEIAQSKCSGIDVLFVKYWVDNGFLTVEGQKMSKSLGNFFTVKDILGEGIEGVMLRYFYCTTHYKKPQDFNKKAIYDARKSVEKFYEAIQGVDGRVAVDNFVALMYLCDDINTPALLAHMHAIAGSALSGNQVHKLELKAACDLLGLDFEKTSVDREKDSHIDHEVIKIADERLAAKRNKNWQLADNLRNQIESFGYNVLDSSDGYKLVRKS